MALTTVRPQGMGFVTGRRNLVINGAMQVAQRGTSTTGLGISHDSYNTVDRYKLLTGGTATAGRFTMSQSSVTDLAGFSNAVKLQCTTADTSIAASEACVLSTTFEGQDLQRLLNTSTSTKAFTVSFYAKANESRAVVLEVRTSHGTNRQIAKLFTITSSWQRFEFNVPASASGMQFGNDTSNDLQLNWWQHAGSTYAGGTLSTDWEGANNANRAVGIGSLFASTSNFFEMTGVQMELGENASDFEHRSYGEELSLCQRYFFKSYPTNRYAGFNTANDVREGACITRNQDGSARSANAWPFHYPVTMRTQPTITSYSLNGTSGKASKLNGNLDHSSDVTNNGYYETAHQNGWQIVEASLDGLGFGGFHVYSDAEL